VGQVLGSVVPTSGSIAIGGSDVIREPARARKACSYQPQTSVPIDGLTPLQAVEIVGRIRGGHRVAVRERANRLIELLELTEWAHEIVPLSGGVARLVAFCMAVVVPGRIVVLDEPTNDIDPLRRKLLWGQVRAVADAGSAVLLVTHNVLEAERCVDRLAIIDGGRVLLAGTPATMKADFHGQLRIEVVLEPETTPSSVPNFLSRMTMSGRRLIADVETSRLSSVIEWATALRDSHVAEEFSVGPVTLEDVYIRQVTPENQEAHPDAVSLS
jgi:ABC-2 type transport system ATP-binding protein